MDVDPRTNVVVFQLNNSADELAIGRAPTVAEDGVRRAWGGVLRNHGAAPESVVALHSEWEPTPTDLAFIEATFPDAAVTFNFSRPKPDGWEEAFAAAEAAMVEAAAPATTTDGNRSRMDVGQPGTTVGGELSARRPADAGRRESADGGEALTDRGEASHDGSGALRDGGQALPGSGALADDGHTLTDDGETLTDSGRAPADSGEALTDSGEALTDSGVALTDSGVALTDDGQALRDGGEALRGSGGAPADSGQAMTDDSQTLAGGSGALATDGQTLPDSGEALTDGGRALRDDGQALAGGGALADGGQALHDGGQSLPDSGQALRDDGQALRDDGQALRDGGQALRDGGEALSGSGEALRGAGEALAGGGEALARAGVDGDEGQDSSRGELLPVLWSASSPRAGMLEAVPHWPVAAGRLHLALAVVAPTPRGTIGMYHVTHHQLGDQSFNELMAEACENLAAGLRVNAHETDEGQLLSLSGTLVAAAVCLPDFYRRLSGITNADRLVVGLPCPDEVYVAAADSPMAAVIHRAVSESEYPTTELIPSVLSIVGDDIEVLFERG